MDPKQPINQLDPKLKEAYERVMGTMPASSTPPQPAVTPPFTPVPQIVTPSTGQMMHETPANAQTTSTTTQASPIPSTHDLISPIPSNPLMNAAPAHPIGPQPMMPSLSTLPPVKPIETIVPIPIKRPDVKSAEPVAQVSTPLHQTTTPTLSGNKPMEPMHATMPLSTTAPVHAPLTQIHGFVAPKKKSGISPVLLILGGVVFVIAYTLVWVKLFNVPLPFFGK